MTGQSIVDFLGNRSSPRFGFESVAPGMIPRQAGFFDQQHARVLWT